MEPDTSALWIGYGFEVPGVVDPHVTIAYYPHATMSDWEQASFLVAKHHKMYHQLFDAECRGFDVFGDRENFGASYVMKVALPPVVLEGISFLRQGLYAGTSGFSTDYGFDPHISYDYEDTFTPRTNEEFEKQTLIGSRYPVNFLHVEYKRKRMSFRYGKTPG